MLVIVFCKVPLQGNRVLTSQQNGSILSALENKILQSYAVTSYQFRLSQWILDETEVQSGGTLYVASTLLWNSYRPTLLLVLNLWYLNQIHARNDIVSHK